MPDAPRVIGRYVVHAEIAAGGMATVHVGRLIGPLGFSRTVAIKRLHPNFAKDPEFVTMFLDEARLAARVRHPNVVPVLDVVAEGGELFLVMDYVAGESFGRLIGASRRRGHAPPARAAATVVAQALHGLHAAHDAKDELGRPLSIVHRDVSPHNILVGTDGVARVLDFGVAKAVGRASITREGELKGKLPYMAPEQIGGAQVSRRTDVYAAGVVLWEALTARRLIEGDGEGEIFAAVLDGAHEPPSAHEPSVPKALDDIAMRALRRDPSERFATALEMALAIEAAIALETPAEIGEWVSSLAEEGLARRARRVAEIESSPGIAVAHATELLEETTAELPRVQLHDEGETRSVKPRSRRRWGLGVVLGALAVSGGVAAAWVSGKSAANAHAQADADAPANADAQANANADAQADANADANADAAADAVADAVPDARVESGAAVKKPKAPKTSCDPPFYYEGSIKRFKPDCVQ